MLSYRIWEALGYKQFAYREQRDLLARAIKAGWTGTEPSVLGTYTSEVALEEAGKFLLEQSQGAQSEEGVA